MANLQRALEIAVEAHRGQLQKDGLPYVLHPIKLMQSVCTFEEQVAALLHDVVEDTDWTLDNLRDEGFTQPILNAVECLTHSEGVSYEDYIEGISKDPIARSVKLADLSDNMDLRRLPALKARDLVRMEKYHKAWQRLNNGD